MFLDSASKSLEIILGTTQTTNPMPVVVDYTDKAGEHETAGASFDTQTSGTTAVTILNAAASSNATNTRIVKEISVIQADTVAKTVTIRMNNNGTMRTKFSGVLQPGDMLGYTLDDGWYVNDVNGNRKTIAGVNFPSLTVSGLVDISNANAGQIKFPTAQNPSADAHTLDDYAEVTWTPTVTAQTGAFTTVSATASYVKIGRQVTANFAITITALGTAATSILLSLPNAWAPNRFNGAGREEAVTGTNLMVYCSGDGNLRIQKYDATFYGANGYILSGTITFFV